jgi:thiamine-monophosphate kinase
VFSAGRSDSLWVVTTDLLLEGVHFQKAWMTPQQLGHKALAVNLSDIAAMGAAPRYYCASLGLPKGVSTPWLRSFYRGMKKLSEKYDAILVGGDLSRSNEGIQISITVLGESSGGKVVYRSGARAGDHLYVTGVLGRSAAGLRLLQQGIRRGRNRAERDALSAHRTPLPRCEVGAWLAANGYARAMMDLSDGLSVDLPRLCRESGVGAEIVLSKIPTIRGVLAELALHGGEDYELLFTVDPRKATRMERRYPSSFPRITRIGSISAAPIVRMKDEVTSRSQALPESGYDHFRN